MKNLKRYYRLPASPEVVYNALTNKAVIEIWTGEDAVMELEAGGAFHCGRAA